MRAAPDYAGDLFSTDGITEPYGHYRAIRDLAPVVRLPAHDLYAVGRCDDVRAVLLDHDTFVSGQGVAINEVANGFLRGTTLASDPPEHDHLRRTVGHRLTPRALRGQQPGIEDKADLLVTELVRRARQDEIVDAVGDIAEAMPLSVVPEFLGFPDDCHDRLIGWAKGATEALGPDSDRTPAAVAAAVELGAYAEALVARRGLRPGSLGDDLLGAADRGDIAVEQCPALLLDYFGPSLETTVSALGSLLALFARHPDQWELLRADPSRAAGAFNEGVRLESPIRGFTRVAARDTDIGGVPLAAGSRVWVLYASANRDERRWERPEEFDITRDNTAHLGLGYGTHGCAGQGLARLEITSLLVRLARTVHRLEPAGPPVRHINSMIRSWASFPLRLELAS